MISRDFFNPSGNPYFTQSRVQKVNRGKSEVPGRTLNICLPLADIKRLSEDFVGKKYGEPARKSNAYRIDTR